MACVAGREESLCEVTCWILPAWQGFRVEGVNPRREGESGFVSLEWNFYVTGYVLVSYMEIINYLYFKKYSSL